MWNMKLATIALVSTIGPVWCTVSFAQEAPPPAPPGGQGSGTEGTPQPGTGGATTTQQVAPNTTVVVQPPATTQTTVTPWGMWGGGANVDKGLSSSSQEAGSSGFDLHGAGSTSPVRGGNNESFVISGQSVSVPLFHSVRRGDTLWDLCDHYYTNPWAWPRVWSYNPQVENPHWIYPGDRLRLRGGDEAKQAQSVTGEGFVNRRPVVAEGTVFLRNRAYIEDGQKEVWGEVSGSPDDQMLLAQNDEVYLHVPGNRDMRMGEELSVFSFERRPEAGTARGRVVDIKGTVRVSAWDPKSHIARATITESIEPLERGDSVGPVGRRFDVVPPQQNGRDLWGTISGEINPREIIGQNQLVLIDKGSEEGLRPGNRLFVVRRGDPWRGSIQMGKAMAAHRMRYQLRKAEMEDAQGTDRGKDYPEEVVGEIRVVRTQPHSSTCVVTQSDFELAPGDKVVARRGY